MVEDITYNTTRDTLYSMKFWAILYTILTSLPNAKGCLSFTTNFYDKILVVYAFGKRQVHK